MDKEHWIVTSEQDGKQIETPFYPPMTLLGLANSYFSEFVATDANHPQQVFEFNTHNIKNKTAAFVDETFKSTLLPDETGTCEIRIKFTHHPH